LKDYFSPKMPFQNLFSALFFFSIKNISFFFIFNLLNIKLIKNILKIIEKF
jgi:hypothetical protein